MENPSSLDRSNNGSYGEQQTESAHPFRQNVDVHHTVLLLTLKTIIPQKTQSFRVTYLGNAKGKDTTS